MEASTSPTEEGEGLSIPFDVGELRGAFYTGASITVLLFLLGGFYLLVKAGVRWLFASGIQIDRPGESLLGRQIHDMQQVARPACCVETGRRV